MQKIKALPNDYELFTEYKAGPQKGASKMRDDVIMMNGDVIHPRFFSASLSLSLFSFLNFFLVRRTANLKPMIKQETLEMLLLRAADEVYTRSGYQIQVPLTDEGLVSLSSKRWQVETK